MKNCKIREIVKCEEGVCTVGAIIMLRSGDGRFEPFAPCSGRVKKSTIGHRKEQLSAPNRAFQQELSSLPINPSPSRNVLFSLFFVAFKILLPELRDRRVSSISNIACGKIYPMPRFRRKILVS